ncbi:MAG: LEA type 2 family protein, partial [Thermoanaerobaculales bacterium]|nr:LEA type 2 family protein [Thermoanaerobaculales bacterium]
MHKLTTNHRPNALPVVLAILAGGLAAGCTTTGGLIPPEVTLVNVELVDATIFESTFTASLRLTNDNPEPLVLDGTVVKLSLEGSKFGRGSSGERVEIPRMSSVVQELELHLNHVAIVTKIKRIIDSKELNYSLSGHVYVLKPSGGTKRLHIEREGTIDLRGEGAIEPVELDPV